MVIIIIHTKLSKFIQNQFEIETEKNLNLVLPPMSFGFDVCQSTLRIISMPLVMNLRSPNI